MKMQSKVVSEFHRAWISGGILRGGGKNSGSAKETEVSAVTWPACVLRTAIQSGGISQGTLTRPGIFVPA